MELNHIISVSETYLHPQHFRAHYNLNLESISVSGQTLPIDQSVFETSSNQGTIIDSGTTLSYLAEDAYDPFVTAVIFCHNDFHSVKFKLFNHSELVFCL